MEQTFYVGIKICDYYAIHINNDGYEQKEMVQENEIDGFIHRDEILKLENPVDIDLDEAEREKL